MKKYILFALLLFACFRANAFEWNTYTININCEPTGAGKVYANESSTENNNNYQDAPYSTTIYYPLAELSERILDSTDGLN